MIICFGFLLYCLKECVFDLSLNWFRGVWLLRKWKKTKEKKGKEMENYWSLSLSPKFVLRVIYLFFS